MILFSTSTITAATLAHYTFDANVQGSASTHHGTAVGGPTSVLGMVGQTISLDGIDHKLNLELSSFGLAGKNTMMISMWANPSRTSSGSYLYLFSKEKYVYPP